MDELVYPKRLHLELTSRCNYKCITCAHGYCYFGEDISNHLKNIIINELIPRAKYLELQGSGESLLYDGLFDILAAARKYHCKTTLITNASLLSKKNLLELVKSNCEIVVSLDSAIKSTYEQIRVNGDFDKVKDHLEYWKFIKNNLFYKYSSSVAINLVLCSYNYKELKEMIDFAIHIEASSLFVSEIRPCSLDNDTWNKLTIKNIKNTQEFNMLLDQAVIYAKEKNFKVEFNFRKNIKQCLKRNICISPWEHAFIRASGEVSVCCELGKSFGNINIQSFKDIWNSSELNQFRKKMAVGSYHAKCKTCCLQWGIV